MVLTKVSLERPSPLPLTRIFKLGILQQVQDKFCVCMGWIPPQILASQQILLSCYGHGRGKNGRLPSTFAGNCGLNRGGNSLGAAWQGAVKIP